MRNLTLAFLALISSACTAVPSSGEPDAAMDAMVQPDADPAQPDASPDACVPHAELCNGIDDDCDGLIDEDFPDLHTTCDNGLLGECFHTGTMVCNGLDGDLSTVCSTAPGVPSPEVCDGLDNDCDGEVDEDFECAAGVTGACTAVCGAAGEHVCGDDCRWPHDVPVSVACQLIGGGGYCDPVAQTGCDACPATWPAGSYSCYVNEVGSSTGYAACLLDPAGTLVEGQGCGGAHDCAPGLTCAGWISHPSIATCRRVCEAVGTVCNPDTGRLCFPEWGWTNRWGTCHD